jgi:hypothetical protein
MNYTFDASLEAIPAAALAEYAAMNDSIYVQHIAYGHSVQHEHLQRSKDAISQTAHVALRQTPGHRPRHALILGAGRCFDIPLPEIVTEFDQTTIVDVDVTSMQDVADALPGRLADKVHLVGAEISGAAAKLATTIEEAGSSSRTYADFIPAASKGIGSLVETHNQPELGGDYAFVCSQLLLTQIVSLPVLFMRSTIAERYHTELSRLPGSPDESILMALTTLSDRLQADHIHQLARVAGRLGTVHFADTYGEVVQAASGQKFILPMVRPVVVDSIEADFEHLRPPESWYWSSTPVREFAVQANALKPR